ncbi:hypothetical protein CASFOL_041688 [Castilleja foliolosa]|uniref:TRUD domain-containing protein n=1 Tax=Castilleja foliolosa TaxID=1961234 RepID=A0ABD3BBE9_9LAMI
MASAQESDVGILCYISHLPCFTGILKQRYSDFIVNEVDLEGNVVRLTSLEAPLEIVVEKKREKITDILDKDYSSELESFRTLAGVSDAEKLKCYVDQIGSGVHNDDESDVFSPSSDKSHRMAIHNFFKERLTFLVTDTVDGPVSSSKCIRVRLNSGNNNNPRGRKDRKRKDRGDKRYDARGSDSWPTNVGKFLRFHLYKENKDTQESLALLGKMLGVQPRSFGFAGTKDKRAVTTQRVTVFKQRASKLAALNEKLIGIKVGNFCYVNEGLVLGQLQGNRFTITLRSIGAVTEDIVRASATALEKNGFINYYGLQRFGSSSISTHMIGAALLRGEWKTAVSMILDPREGDVTKKIREYYKESGDIEGTLRQLPRYMVAERAILHCLKKCPGNYLQALSAIPRTLRMMFGFDQVVLGDLVRCKEQETKKEMTSSHSTCEDEIDNNDTLIDCHLDEISVTDLSDAKNMSVKVISDEDIVAEKYSIDDIVLPLPGSRIIYPLNDIVNIYHDLAKKDGISLTDSAHNSKEFSLTNMTGAYRQVIQKPKDFEWKLINYENINIPLAETDWDIISKSGTSSTPIRPSDESDQIKRDREEDKIQTDESIAVASKTQMALKMSLTLPSSCYATMAIRELLKTSTSMTGKEFSGMMPFKRSNPDVPTAQSSRRDGPNPPTTSYKRRLQQALHEPAIVEDDMVAHNNTKTTDDSEMPVDQAPEAEAPQTSRARKGKAVRGDDWLLMGPSPGGPYIPELIPSFAGHVAADIWRGKERDTPRCHHRGQYLEAWPGLTGEAEELVRRTGLYHLRKFHYNNPDCSLIAAFIERWQPDTNTFHMPWGEMTITLHDVEFMLGLKVTGKPLHSLSRTDSLDLYGELVGELPCSIPPIFGSTGPTYTKIKLVADESEQSGMPPLHRARMYLLYLISATLFVDRSTNRVKPEYLHLVWDIDEAAGYAWGAGVLAHLYRYLGETSRADTKQMCGCLTLLECWIYEYFPRFRPCTNPHYREGMPRAIAWYNPYRPVHWVPSERDVIRDVPNTLFLGSLRCLTDTEVYHPNRVLRQFGLLQTVPGPPIKPIDGCYRGRNGTAYKVQYPCSDGTWNIQGAGQLHLDVYDTAAHPRWMTSPDYMGWYLERTHSQIHPGEAPAPIAPVPQGDLLSELTRVIAAYDPDDAAIPPAHVWRSVYDLLRPTRDRLRLDKDEA